MNKKNFRIFSWGLVAYTVLVILWGAVVRATGSGAGCGSHWPLCNGEVIPQLEAIETKIELFHRVTSAFDGVLVIGLVIWAFYLFGRKSTVTLWAFLALAFIIIEGLLGRMLVVQEWVADHVSVMRAVVVAIHLMNTYVLLMTLVVTAWLSGRNHKIDWRGDRKLVLLVGAGLVISMLFSAMGAVTALGDTLFPPESIVTEIQRDFDPASNFLIRLRVIHPVIAIVSSGYLYGVVRYTQGNIPIDVIKKRGNFLLVIIGLQVLAGGLTILTLAPLAMQITHLLLADIFWISLVLFGLEVFTKPVRKSS